MREKNKGPCAVALNSSSARWVSLTGLAREVVGMRVLQHHLHLLPDGNSSKKHPLQVPK